MPNYIKELDDILRSKIAAGEVVERPASVVKELLENSIDAGATQIYVEIKNAGKSLIKVSDNGWGMSREDALLSLKRHTTSKISKAEDLFSVTTFGFRGEALASIAAVSRLTLTTVENPELRSAYMITHGDFPASFKTREAAEVMASLQNRNQSFLRTGTRILVDGGQVKEVEEIAGSFGTSVEVQDLFYNVPARLKFLKSDSTETSHIVRVVETMAIAFPMIRFRVTVDGRTVFQSVPSKDNLVAASAILGKDTVKNMLYFSAVHDSPASNTSVFDRTPKHKLQKHKKKDDEGDKVEDRITEADGADTDDTNTGSMYDVGINLGLERIELEGWISKPGFSRSTADMLFVYVNSRPVKSQIIQKAILA